MLSIPKHRFILWLSMKQRLRMRSLKKTTALLWFLLLHIVVVIVVVDDDDAVVVIAVVVIVVVVFVVVVDADVATIVVVVAADVAVAALGGGVVIVVVLVAVILVVSFVVVVVVDDDDDDVVVDDDDDDDVVVVVDDDVVVGAYGAQLYFPSLQIIKKHLKNGKNLSTGFGFVELDSIETATNVCRDIQGTVLDGHALVLQLCHARKNEKVPTKASNDRSSTKLIVRNVAFEATEKDLRQLFSPLGQIKTLRLPMKVGKNRGFAFIEFVTKQEAQNALNTLSNTHLYGRHLVLERAKEDGKKGARTATTYPSKKGGDSPGGNKATPKSGGQGSHGSQKKNFNSGNRNFNKKGKHSGK
ncbi:hypothetical protein BVRB_010840 [Beta vulgaris subsp. vulgaris]|uniref:RRM domain-containing protein n=1 Tax=Beta vulgaris subsp. vulgaris TaxID=3555 RepID=A0A0J8B2K6_BETVV|nr:hypothetical protein BVRB_010840 [Beta vulgaris subsp. vulgaris]